MSIFAHASCTAERTGVRICLFANLATLAATEFASASGVPHVPRAADLHFIYVVNLRAETVA